MTRKNRRKRPLQRRPEKIEEIARRHLEEHRNDPHPERIRYLILEVASHLIETSGLTARQQLAAKALRGQTVNLFYQQGKIIAGKSGGAETIPISGKSLKSMHQNMFSELKTLLANKKLDLKKRKWLESLQEESTPFYHKLQSVADEKSFFIPTNTLERIIEAPLLCHLDLLQMIMGRKFKKFITDLEKGIGQAAFPGKLKH